MADIFLKLLNISITAGYLVIAVLLLRLLLKNAPKRIRGILWGFVGVRLIVPFSFESIFSIIPSAEIISSDTVKYSTMPEVTSGIPMIDNTLNPIVGSTFAADPTGSVTPLYVITEIAGLIWFVGIGVMLMYALISTLKIKKQVRESVKIKDNIFMCDAVKSPFILGVIRPKIYIPSYIDIKTENLIISHELAHIKRGDHFWKPFGFLLLSVYWFNPLMWIGYVFLCKDIELSCDEKVIKGLNKGEIADYSEALLKFNAPRSFITVCPIAFGEVSVKERVKSVLNYKKPAFRIIVFAVIICIVTAVCLLTNPYTKNGANDKLSSQKEIIVPEKSLQDKYPEFFGLNSKSGLTVYIWQTGEWNYRCFLMSSIDAAKIDLTGAFQKSASIGEMRAILDFYGISKDKVTVTPVRNPISSYYVPNLDEAYSKKLETIFWASDDAAEPPELTVQDGRSIISAQKGTYSWTGKDAATGNMVTKTADSPFSFKEQKEKLPKITVPKIKSKYENKNIILQFNFLQPDTVRISYYDEQGKKILFSDKLSFELKKGSYVYEVDAFFGDNRVQYGFVGCYGN